MVTVVFFEGFAKKKKRQAVFIAFGGTYHGKFLKDLSEKHSLTFFLLLSQVLIHIAEC